MLGWLDLYRDTPKLIFSVHGVKTKAPKPQKVRERPPHWLRQPVAAGQRCLGVSTPGFSGAERLFLWFHSNSERASGRKTSDMREARALAAFGRTKWYELLASGALPIIKFNQRTYRIRESDLDAWIAAGWVEPLRADGVYKYSWVRTLRRLKLPGVTIHGARHSYATMLLESGESMKLAQETLGHSSITVTADLYSHVTPTFRCRAADALAAHLERARTNGGGAS